MAQMVPQTRHYTECSRIFEHFEEHFTSVEEFGKNKWQTLGAEKFSKKWFVPGAQFGATPYQLKDAVALGALVFSPLNTLGTRAAVMFHFNYTE